MRNRVALVFLVGMLAGALMFAGGFVVATSMADDAEAQAPQTWQIAGPSEGFAVEDWGMGYGPERSLDDWVQTLPATCDFQILDRGLSFDTILYRCPES